MTSIFRKCITGSNPIEIDGAFAIYAHDLANYRRDRIYAAKQLRLQKPQAPRQHSLLADLDLLAAHARQQHRVNLDAPRSPRTSFVQCFLKPSIGAQQKRLRRE
jgi:hypothetical protein